MPAKMAAASGLFYVIQLFPDVAPGRVKLGFTTNIAGRLAAHRTTCPGAAVLRVWPCRKDWEAMAITCAGQGCRRLSAEVFDCEDADRLVARAGEFFAIMPAVVNEPAVTPAAVSPSSRLSYGWRDASKGVVEWLLAFPDSVELAGEMNTASLHDAWGAVARDVLLHASWGPAMRAVAESAANGGASMVESFRHSHTDLAGQKRLLDYLMLRVEYWAEVSPRECHIRELLEQDPCRPDAEDLLRQMSAISEAAPRLASFRRPRLRGGRAN